MTVLVVIELTCDQCERTGEHRAERVNVCTAEQFVQRRMAGWNVDPHGRALCPECFAESRKVAQQLARRAERSARDKTRHRGELQPTGDAVRVVRG